jgi:hypothetical protein
MQGDRNWHAIRDECAVTYSRAADAIGVGYKSRIMYMQEKLGLRKKEEDNWRMTEGIRWEPWVAELYYEIMGSCRCPVDLGTKMFVYNEQDKRMGGSPDRIVKGIDGGEDVLLEIKTCPDGIYREYIPVSHIVQIACLCHDLKLKTAHYICWTPNEGILMCEMTFDPTLYPDILYPLMKEFADLFDAGTLPPRMKEGQKELIEELIRRRCFIDEIPSVGSRRLLQECQQTTIN